MAKKTSLLPVVKKYFEHDPLSAARALESLTEEEAIDVLKSIPVHMAADAVRRMSDSFSAVLLSQLPQDRFTAIVDKLDAQQGASILLALPTDKRGHFLEILSEKKKRKIQELLSYPEDSAGRLMSTQFLSIQSDLKVKDAVLKVREAAQKGMPPSYAYVVDQQNRLVGIMTMRDTLLAERDASVESVMKRDVFSVSCFMDREQIANELGNRRYFAAPVVDPENRMLGIIKSDQLLSEVQEEASEDLQRMFGAGGDERPFSPMVFSLKKRLPWLHVNLATAFLAASVVALFQDVISRITVLAVFLPVVAGQGGNAGAQSLAVVMRGLVMREIPKNRARSVIFKEASIGAIGGLIIGIVTAAISWLWQGNPFLGVVVGLGMIVNLTVAGFSGAAIPILMKSLGLDPAQCSNIILTTITDVIGFFSFLGFAVLFQAYLI